MLEFDPRQDVENSQLILDDGEWPNFHDAELHNLNIWRGDVRPDDDLWIGPVIEASFELCALQFPYMVTLKFHDCDAIRLAEFNHQNALYDLTFKYQARGNYTDGKPLPHVLQWASSKHSVWLSPLPVSELRLWSAAQLSNSRTAKYFSPVDYATITTLISQTSNHIGRYSCLTVRHHFIQTLIK